MADHSLRRTVGEFHAAAGVQRLMTLNFHERLAMVALRAQLITEEARELHSAECGYVSTHNQVAYRHMAKELADLLYVTAGTADVLATPLADPSDMRIRMIPQFFASSGLKQKAGYVVSALDLLVAQVSNDWDDGDLEWAIGDIGSEIQDLSDACFIFALSYGIPLMEAFQAVHTSNMTKVDQKSGKILYREDGKVLKGPGYREADLSFIGLVA